MPMPSANTPWPLPEYKHAMRAIQHDDAVITGKLDILNSHRRAAEKEARPYSHRAQ